MKFTYTVEYDATAAEVAAMLTDPEFRTLSVKNMGAVAVDVQVTTEGGNKRLVIDQTQPTSGVPAIAKKFVGETTRAIQTEVWEGSSGASFAIDSPGNPSKSTGRITLTEANGVTTETWDIETKVSIPLMGGKLEPIVADVIKAGMDTEHATGVAWLKGER